MVTDAGRDLFGGSYREGPVIQAFSLKTGQTQATPLTFDKSAADDVDRHEAGIGSSEWPLRLSPTAKCPTRGSR